ncbi:hypothetical protein MPH48_03335 [Lysinibacillus fusiformis]|uniref:hypothetical protein n=1 Tax=Lysinibacillus fusiformis TaxID=28031 RepID=UPI001F4F0039|nr:hypothetical protein [Lysinibacillus fusiformis]MCK1987131.1 hypothetical protein [Lysinibacillus fusiformis]
MTKTKNERITTLENEVAELKLIVHELRGKKSIESSTILEDIIEFEGQQYKKVDRKGRKGDVVIFRNNNTRFFTNGVPYKVAANGRPVDNEKEAVSPLYHDGFGRTPETVDVYELIEPKPLTQNQQRAEIIEKAKKFVEKVSSQQSSWAVNENGNETYQQKCTFNDFIINNEKRTVVVLVKGEDSGKIFEKGIAKCNPSDVFNEHIGKAIALGRALGLDVSEFEQVVQPNEVVVGMVVETFINIEEHHKTIKVEKVVKDSYGIKLFEHLQTAFFTPFEVECGDKISNDTYAKYEVSSNE